MWWFGKRKATRTEQRPEDAAIAFFGAALGEICPGCKQSLAQHRFAQFASLAIRRDNHDEVLQYFTTFKKGDWGALAHYQSFDSAMDALITYALECPLGQHTIVAIRNPFDLYDNEEVMTFSVVTSSDFDQLRSLVEPGSWKQF